MRWLQVQTETMMRARTSSANNTRSKKIDRISSLPDDILLLIINLLTMKEAIRTSVLSRRWKSLYAYRPKLEFNWLDIISSDPITYAPNPKAIANKHARDFQYTIEDFLASYLGNKIETFKMRCCLGNEHTRYYRGWIKFAVARFVETIDLSFTMHTISHRRMAEFKCSDYYTIPTEALASGSESKLRNLFLRTCKMKPDVRDRFRALATLTLCDVRFIGKPQAADFFSSYSNLETLRLEWCVGFGRLRFDSSNACLKKLVVKECTGLKSIGMNGVTNLTSFHCVGDKVDLKLQQVSNLVDIYVKMRKVNVNKMFDELEKVVSPNYKNMVVAKS